MSKKQTNTVVIDELLEKQTLGLFMNKPEEITEETDFIMLMVAESEMFGDLNGDDRQNVIFMIQSMRDACIALNKYHADNMKGGVNGN